MPVHNADITVFFEEIADPLEIEGANTFHIRALQGIGDTTVAAFLRELPGIRSNAAPPLSPLALSAAMQLNSLPWPLLQVLTAFIRTAK